MTTSMTILFIFVSILPILFIAINFSFAPHNPYQEKYSIFECGYHGFLWQNRIEFDVQFIIFGLAYLIFEMEILAIYPFAISMYQNSVYGFWFVIIFIAIISIGFGFELGKKALVIVNKQNPDLK